MCSSSQSFTPGSSVACATLPHTAVSLLPPLLSPSIWVNLPGAQLQELWDLDQLVSRNLHSSAICKELWTVCHPQGLCPKHPQAIAHCRFSWPMANPVWMCSWHTWAPTQPAGCVQAWARQAGKGSQGTHVESRNCMLGMHQQTYTSMKIISLKLCLNNPH